jgi:hypothetical protein
MQFLEEAVLIQTAEAGSEPIIELSSADLSGVNLSHAYLSGAYLSGADLSEADLSGANVIKAELTAADLSNVRGWTEEQLTAAKSLEGATMPDGQILKSDDNPDGPTFEEWLKSKGRAEDGEKSGPQ